MTSSATEVVNLAEGDVNKMKRKERKREWGLAML
jgi:hypothetical protein